MSDHWPEEYEEALFTAFDRALSDVRNKIVDRFAFVSDPDSFVAAPGDQPIKQPVGEIFDPEWWERAVEFNVLPVIEEVLVGTGETVAGTLGVDLSVTNPNFEPVLNQHLVSLKGYNDSLISQVGQTLQVGYEKGLSIEDLTTELRATAGLGETSARAFARTEVNAAVNGASDVVYVSSPAVGKRWLTALDEDVRDSHAELDGMTIPAGEDFLVGVGRGPYPGAPSLPIGERVNCRCAIVPVQPDEFEFRVRSRTFDVPERLRSSFRHGRPQGFADSPPDSDGFSDGAMVCLRPVRPDLIAVEDGIEADDLHVTLQYLGKVDDLDMDERAFDALIADLTAIAEDSDWVAVDSWTIDHFGGPDVRDAGYVAVVASPAEGQDERINEFQSRIAEVLDDNGLVDASSFAGEPYRAHMTLTYLPEGEAIEQYPIGSDWSGFEGEPVVFDHVGVVLGEEETRVLMGRVDESEAAAESNSVGSKETFVTGGETVPYLIDEASSECGAETPIAVVKEGDGEVMGCHATVEEAEAQVTALNLAEADESEAAADDGAEAGSSAEKRFRGTVIPEGIMSGDRRKIALGALTFRDFPLPVMLQTKNDVGHFGSELAGNFDSMERVSVSEERADIVGDGGFDMGGEVGREAARLVEDKKLRGISADIDSVEVEIQNESGAVLTEEEMMDAFFGDLPFVEVLVQGRVMGATLTPFPAFQEASVEIVSLSDENTAEDAKALVAVGGKGKRFWRFNTPISGDDDAALVAAGTLTAGTFMGQWALGADALVASAGAPTLNEDPVDRFPVYPPADRFALLPGDAEAFTVYADGSVYGLIAEFGSCHIGFGDRCVDVPKASDGYSHARNKNVLTAEGDLIAVANVFANTVHPDLALSASDTLAHYHDTGQIVAQVAIYENHQGIVLAGSLMPDITPAQEARFRASDVSPDWRSVPGQPGLTMVGLLAVNVSGFVVPALVASGSEETGRIRVRFNEDDQPTALVAAGIVHNRVSPIEKLHAELTAMRSELATFKRIAEFDSMRSAYQRRLAARFAAEGSEEAKAGCPSGFNIEDMAARLEALESKLSDSE